MKADAVSETVGAFVLVAIAMLVIAILALVFFANPLPTRVPSFAGLISNRSTTIYISHEGGDPLLWGQYKILVDNVDETWDFMKSLPDANRTFSLGKVMNATLPKMSKRVVVIFNSSWGGGTVLLSADLTKTQPQVTYGWFSPDWSYRRKITIDHNKVPSDQSDFPVLYYDGSGNLAGYHTQNPSGNDILFTDSTGMRKLSHEIEFFDHNSGTLWAWVKVPTLSSSANTVIYLYYGNSAATSQQNAADVWSNGYAGVWHLGESTATTRFDSTGNHNDLKSINGVAQAGGKIGNAASFTAASFMNLSIADGSQTGLDITGPITLEAWVNFNPVDAGQPYYIIQKSEGAACGAGDPPYYLRLNTGDATHMRENVLFASVCGNPGTGRNGASNSMVVSTWYQATGIYDGTNLFLYKNAVQTSTIAYSSGIFNSAGPFVIGSHAGDHWINGLIDEARVSNTARSPDWLTTENNNQNTPGVGGFLISVGSEQTPATMS